MTPWTATAILSIVLAVLWQYFFYVLPSMRRANIAENMLSFTDCLLELNQNALPNGKITNGSYIHDYFYKFLVSILYEETIISYPSLFSVKWDKDSEDRIKLFDSELNKLGARTKASVTGAVYSVSRIMFLKHPLKFIYLFLTLTHVKKDTEKG